LIVAAGIHTFNLKDGSGWDYNAVTGKKIIKALWLPMHWELQQAC
jgi:hypothetical protein